MPLGGIWYRLALAATLTLIDGSLLAAQGNGGIPLRAGRTGGIVRVLSSLPPEAAEFQVTLEQAARRFLDGYFGLWSQSNFAAMALVEGEYADLVDFYGKPTPRQTIVDAKRRYVERWPERSYTVRPGSLRIACDGATCLVSGTVDWDCRSAERGAHSVGVSDFTVRVAFDPFGAAKIVLEAGSVIARSAAP